MESPRFPVFAGPVQDKGAVGVLLWIAALYLAVRAVGAPMAIDFPPMYGAGSALLRGEPLYAVPRFVAPFAATLFAPFAVADYDTAAYAYSVVQVVVPLAAAGLVGASLAPRHRVAASGLCAVVLSKSDVFVQSLGLFNPSLLFVLPLVVSGCCGAGTGGPRERSSSG